MIRFHPEQGWQQFTKDNGLSDNTIYAVYPDDYGHLWLSSNYGLMRFHRQSHQVKSYLELDGISNLEFNRISHYQHEDGTLFFGSLHGVTVFHPSDLLPDSSSNEVPLVITDFRQFDAEGEPKPAARKLLREHNRIVMDPQDSFF